MKNIDAVIDVLGNLKNLKRTGWMRNNVTDAESVADHTFGTTFLVLMFAPEHLNLEKCLNEFTINHQKEKINLSPTLQNGGNSPQTR